MPRQHRIFRYESHNPHSANLSLQSYQHKQELICLLVAEILFDSKPGREKDESPVFACFQFVNELPMAEALLS